MNHKNAVEALESFGFSTYEARAYLALQQEAPVTGYQLSKNAGVPRSRVYETIERLLDKGYAIKIEGDPVTYSALSPEGLMSRIRVGFNRNLNAIAEFAESAGEGEATLHIREPGAVAAWIADLVGSANRTIVLHTDTALDNRRQAALEAAVRRGVRAILHAPNAPSAPGIKHYTAAGSGGSESGESFQLLIDGEVVFFGNSERATWSREPEMLRRADESIRLRIARDEMLRQIGKRAVLVLTEIEYEFAQAGQPQPPQPHAAGLSIRPTLRTFPGIRTGEAIIEPVR